MARAQKVKTCASQHLFSRENPDLQASYPQPLTAVQVEGKSFSQWDKALVVHNDYVSWWQHVWS